MIEIQNLSKKFGDVTVLNNISLSANGVLGVCGDAGSGKSTLLEIIAGIIPASDGKILVDGKELLANNTTLLFVSHSAETVKQICKRAIWLDAGQMKLDSTSEEACQAYAEYMG